jgi:hypothetical protein
MLIGAVLAAMQQIFLLLCSIWPIKTYPIASQRRKSMSKSNSQAWNTKFGPRRVRHDEPTLEEAIAAAQGLTDDLDAQAEIAAALMGLPYDEVRKRALLKPSPVTPRRNVISSVAFSGPALAPRTVVVERKPARRVFTAASR